MLRSDKAFIVFLLPWQTGQKYTNRHESLESLLISLKPTNEIAAQNRYFWKLQCFSVFILHLTRFNFFPVIVRASLISLLACSDYSGPVKCSSF